MAALIDTGIFFGFYSLRDGHPMDSLAIVVHATEGAFVHNEPHIGRNPNVAQVKFHS